METQFNAKKIGSVGGVDVVENDYGVSMRMDAEIVWIPDNVLEEHTWCKLSDQAALASYCGWYLEDVQALSSSPDPVKRALLVWNMIGYWGVENLV